MAESIPSIGFPRSASTAGLFARLAWLPIPLLLAAILACRLADLRADYAYD